MQSEKLMAMAVQMIERANAPAGAPETRTYAGLLAVAGSGLAIASSIFNLSETIARAGRPATPVQRNLDV